VYDISVFGKRLSRKSDDVVVFPFGAGERWRRSAGPIMSEMKKYYLESVSRGISYMK
jgi:hypothetical protein